MYERLAAKDFTGALQCFTGVAADSSSAQPTAMGQPFPLAIIGVFPGEQKQTLKLVPLSLLDDLQVRHNILDIRPDGDGWLVTEEIHIVGKSVNGGDIISVHNPEHRYAFVREEGEWKIDSMEKVVVFHEADPARQSWHMLGLCYTPDGISTLMLDNRYVEMSTTLNKYLTSGEKGIRIIKPSSVK
jgi:hypothetical protein